MTQSRQDSDDWGSRPNPLPGEGAASPVQANRDHEGIPIDDPVGGWLDLPTPMDSRRLLAILRYTRTDGSVVFGPLGRSLERLRRLDLTAADLLDPSLAAVVARWLPSGRSSSLAPSPTPLPFDSRPDRTLAILRADWTPRGEYLAVDHRQVGPETALEIALKGHVWLGPKWTSSLLGGRLTRPRPTGWTSTPFAQSLEWSFQAGRSRVTRVVSLLRGRSMALLGQQVEGAISENEVRLTLGVGVEASFVEGSRALRLSKGPGKPSIRLIPLGLPAHDRPSDRGSITVEEGDVVIRQVAEGRKSWLSVLLTWNKPPSFWRELTVACRSKASKPDQAVAFRVAWGLRDPGLVLYRSLDPPELRSFLGHQTTSRFVIGSFTTQAEVAPILKVDS